MIKHISFPSIEQFRHTIATVNRKSDFVGLDANGEAIYDPNRLKPTLTFKGTVKLHGTNFSVCYNDTDGMWVQSRENIITPEKDNAGSAFFAVSNKEVFMSLFNKVKEKHNIDTSVFTISIFGEWAGKGVQKGVAINNIDKSMFVFGCKISKLGDAEFDAFWVDSSDLKSPEHRIYNVEDFQTYSIDIDFNNPKLSQNSIIDMTIAVEESCPVGKAFGFEGIGEGIVFTHVDENGHRLLFKSKGEKHAASSKVKTLTPVDEEKLGKVAVLVEKVTPQWRLEQMLEAEFNLMNGGTIDIKRIGNYIKLVVADVIKEESDIIAEAGLEPKDLNKGISEVARKYFFAQQNASVGL